MNARSKDNIFICHCKSNAYEKINLSQVTTYYTNIDWISTHQKLLKGIQPPSYPLHCKKALFYILILVFILDAKE